jgi:hypothetical protein
MTTTCARAAAMLLLVAACRPGTDVRSGAPHESGATTVTGGGPSGLGPANCNAVQGKSTWWIGLEKAGVGPRMAQVVLQHDPGVIPDVTPLDAVQAAQKQLSTRERGSDRTRVIAMSTTNTLTMSAGPFACVRLPSGASLSLSYAESSFAPAGWQAGPDTVALHPVSEASR